MKLPNQILESPKGLNVFSLDKNYYYLVFNSNHKNIMKSIWGDTIKQSACILDFIKNEDDKKARLILTKPLQEKNS